MLSHSPINAEGDTEVWTRGAEAGDEQQQVTGHDSVEPHFPD